MENNTQKKVVDQDIDLFLLFKSIGVFFDKMGFAFYRMIMYFVKNIVITIIITIIGLLLGWYLNENDKKAYRHEVVVATNFKSTEYLYNRVKQFSAQKINTIDFNQNIFDLKIEPVVDVFEFVSDNKNNVEIAKYMSENTIEVNKFKKDNNVEKLYKYHKLTYYTKVFDTNNKIFEKFMSELNSDKYFLERQKIEYQDTEKRLNELEISVASINQIFNKLGTPSSGNELNVQMYAQINDLMLTKQDLLRKINQTKVALLEEKKIIFDTSAILNVYNKSIFKMILPALAFNFIFLLIGILTKYFRKYKIRSQQNTHLI